MDSIIARVQEEVILKNLPFFKRVVIFPDYFFLPLFKQSIADISSIS